MASDTVPAAVPGPTDPPASPAGTTEPGGLTGLLSAVDPARPAGFHITPTTDTPGGPDAFGQADLGASSAAYQDLTDPQQTAAGKAGGTASGKDTGVVRAFLLAGAERWRKGADARLKQLDIKKARAQAFKESRKVNENRTVNRAEKIVGGSTNSTTGSNTNSGKSLNGKSGGGSPAVGSKTVPKNAAGPGGGRGGKGPSGTQHNGQEKAAHRDGPGLRSAARDRAAERIRNGPKEKDNTSQKHAQDAPAHRTGPGVRSAVRDRTADRIRNGPKDKNAANAGPDRTGKQQSGTAPKVEHTTARETPPDRTPKSGKDRKAPKDGGTPNPTATDTKDKAKDTTGPKPAHDGGPANSGPDKDPKTSKGKGPADEQNKDTLSAGARIDTRPSRETGYRDGSRAAQAAAHVGAYRDGVRDGWTDTRQAADRDKARLDKAHADRRKQREQTTTPAPAVPPKPVHPPTPPRPKDPPMPQPDTAAPQTATPIKVDNVGATHLRLGDGAARPYMSRGEVRSLKTFERRLQDRTQSMTKVAEASKVLHAQAVDQATKATRLMESAKAVKGGEKLAAALTRLQEAAQIQALKAEETHRRALRAADNCKALLANVETRYGPLYQAVVDSPETEPAETHFYLGDHSG